MRVKLNLIWPLYHYIFTSFALDHFCDFPNKQGVANEISDGRNNELRNHQKNIILFQRGPIWHQKINALAKSRQGTHWPIPKFEENRSYFKFLLFHECVHEGGDKNFPTDSNIIIFSGILGMRGTFVPPCTNKLIFIIKSSEKSNNDLTLPGFSF